MAVEPLNDQVSVPEMAALRDALARTERELATILELSPSAVRVIDLAGSVIRANTLAQTELGGAPPRTMRELWERDQPRRLEDDSRLAFLETPAMRALTGVTIRGELLAVRGVVNEAPRVLEINAAPLHDGAGRVAGAVVLDRDVSESRRLERILDREALRSAELESRVMTEADRIEQIVEERAQALQAREEIMARDRRLAAIGQLAAGVMHDVNNALNPIMAAAYLLRHHAESPDAVRDYADRIRMAAETGAATASRVGRFIRQDPMHSGANQVLDLSALAEEVLELTDTMRQQRAGGASQVRVVREFGAQVITRGIPGEIREALLNLLSNAMDALPKGGTLTVRTSVAGDRAQLTVQDDGLGMTAEVRERAFEPFFTTKGAGGSGLGLAEVYGIARRHRGSVVLESAPGAGTSVTLHLPLELADLPTVVTPASAKSSTPLRILLVEDHNDGREFLRRLLQANGHSVDAVASCAEARVQLAAAPSTGYHLMLTDVGLPDGNGWDLVSFARMHHPVLRVGVITGWEPMVSSAEALGAEFVLRKPLRTTELLAHIAGNVAPALPEQ